MVCRETVRIKAVESEDEVITFNPSVLLEYEGCWEGSDLYPHLYPPGYRDYYTIEGYYMFHLHLPPKTDVTQEFAKLTWEIIHLQFLDPGWSSDFRAALYFLLKDRMTFKDIDRTEEERLEYYRDWDRKYKVNYV